MTKQRKNGHSIPDDDLDAQVAVADARGAAERDAGLRASSARYDVGTRRVVLELTNGTSFAFPIALVPGLKRATHAQRAAMTLTPLGDGVLWEDLDTDVSVPGILNRTFGKAFSARLLGSLGGMSTSDAKRDAARANGSKGGRPRKT